jgi:rRNA-processing protein FCF1
MIIPDTGIWINFFKSDPAITQHLTLLVDKKKVFALDCVFGELLQGVKNKKEREEIMYYWNKLPKIHLKDIFVRAGLYSCEHKLHDKGVGLIDAVILMYGMESKSLIWTLDKKLLRVIPPELIYQAVV